jgi:hypothetical protein
MHAPAAYIWIPFTRERAPYVKPWLDTVAGGGELEPQSLELRHELAAQHGVAVHNHVLLVAQHSVPGPVEGAVEQYLVINHRKLTRVICVPTRVCVSLVQRQLPQQPVRQVGVVHVTATDELLVACVSTRTVELSTGVAAVHRS